MSREHPLFLNVLSSPQSTETMPHFFGDAMLINTLVLKLYRTLYVWFCLLPVNCYLVNGPIIDYSTDSCGGNGLCECYLYLFIFFTSSFCLSVVSASGICNLCISVLSFKCYVCVVLCNSRSLKFIRRES